MTRLAARMARVAPNEIGTLLRLGAEPGVISFGGGYPDASMFPTEELADIFQTALTDTARNALQYTVSNGPLHLRTQIAGRMVAQGIACFPDEVLVLQGGQQGLDLVAKMLLDPGDLVITESPTFLGALIAFDPYQPRYAGIPMDGEGMDMEALARVLAANPGAKMLYTVPDFQNPTGVTLSLERRHRLMELARAHDLIVLEDIPYRPLRFTGSDLPTLKSLDTDGRVILLGSFSKMLAPGLRIGWAVANPDLIQRLGLLKLAADTQCSTLNMAAVSMFMDRHDIDDHVDAIRDRYHAKKRLMLGAIRQHFPQSVGCTDPDGGMFTWLTFPDGFDAADFMARHALPEARVAYVPGATFFPEAPRANHARVNFTGQPDEAIVQGMEALGRLLRQHMD